jgi:hypothetical protein
MSHLILRDGPSQSGKTALQKKRVRADSTVAAPFSVNGPNGKHIVAGTIEDARKRMEAIDVRSNCGFAADRVAPRNRPPAARFHSSMRYSRPWLCAVQIRKEGRHSGCCWMPRSSFSRNRFEFSSQATQVKDPWNRLPAINRFQNSRLLVDHCVSPSICCRASTMWMFPRA